MPIVSQNKLISDMTCTEIFEEIGRHQVLALMFHDHMRDLYDFLNLSGFKCWHKHQYTAESEEFINTKHYFMSTHNKLLKIDDPGQPIEVIPENWYNYTRLEVTPQLLRQHVEASFNAYRSWEENTKRLYEECSKALFDMGYTADSEKVNELVKDVISELDMLYKVLLKLKASGYDVVYILEMQSWLHKKYK